jgi:DNA-directed RNA polymerase subunit L
MDTFLTVSASLDGRPHHKHQGAEADEPNITWALVPVPKGAPPRADGISKKKAILRDEDDTLGQLLRAALRVHPKVYSAGVWVDDEDQPSSLWLEIETRQAYAPERALQDALQQVRRRNGLLKDVFFAAVARHQALGTVDGHREQEK